MDNTGRPDPKYFWLWQHITKNLKSGDKLAGGKPKPEAVFREAQDALVTLASEWNGIKADLRTNQDAIVLYTCNWNDGKAEFKDLLVEDFKVRKYIKKKYSYAGIPKVEIERTRESNYVLPSQ